MFVTKERQDTIVGPPRRPPTVDCVRKYTVAGNDQVRLSLKLLYGSGWRTL